MKNKKPEEKTYYSIRVVKAINKTKALDKIVKGEFEDAHHLCDVVLLENGTAGVGDSIIISGIRQTV